MDPLDPDRGPGHPGPDPGVPDRGHPEPAPGAIGYVGPPPPQQSHGCAAFLGVGLGLLLGIAASIGALMLLGGMKGPCSPHAGLVLGIAAAVLSVITLWVIVRVRPTTSPGVVGKALLVTFTVWQLLPWPCSWLGAAFLLFKTCGH